jgi:hypothetical protein
MIDLKLNKDGDLDLLSSDLLWVDGAQRVKQQLEIKLKLWQGEWFLNTDFGTPYLNHILGKQISLNGALAALKASIYEVDGISDIESFTHEYDRQNRGLNLHFTAITPYGLVEYQDNQ